MKPETYPDYIAYEINYFYFGHPYGPDRCPMCAGDLLQSEIEPSKAMHDEIVRTTSGEDGYYVLAAGSFLFTCNECRWWCVRDACQFIDRQAVHKFAHDYLIFALTGQGEPDTSGDMLEKKQPWLKALDDPDVYNSDVLRRFPKELAPFIYKQPDSPEGTSISRVMINNLSEYDRFIDRARELTTKMRKKRLLKAEPVRLNSGDKVRIITHVHGNMETYPRKIVATQGSIGTILSYDEYHDGEKSNIKKWADEGVRYPVRLEMVASPSEADLAFWRELFIFTRADCEIGQITLLDADCLEKIR
jgi:hypothetical protein